jgi:serine/threonine protein phosphatase PrpC
LQAFYGVYDGHGGRAAVDFVSERLGKNVVAAVLATTELQEAAAEAPSSVDATAAAIRAAYLATDSEFLGQVCSMFLPGLFWQHMTELNASTHAASAAVQHALHADNGDLHHHSIRVWSVL